MYDQAVSFFEHIIRANRPVSDILYADYDYLNQPLAKYYGLKLDLKNAGPVELVENAGCAQSRRSAASRRHAHHNLRPPAHQPG